MRFEDGMPTDLYLNAHSFGAFYTYGPGIFTFVRGKSYVLNNQANFILYFVKIQQELITIESPPQTATILYPLTVHLADGFHPELFVANGSHGIWGGPGRFEYARTPRLFDYTSRGFGWKTWLNLVMVDATDNLANTGMGCKAVQ